MTPGDAKWRGHPVPGTAPEQLAMVSWVHGGPCPPVRGARVLEVGCGDGANLVPLAWYRRDCEFVGVDLSGEALALAREGADALGLSNVALHRADLATIGSSLGTFDYVVAHGVLSWVPTDVQRAYFAMCRACLEPDGLAYVSFNAQPGWLVRGMVRDLLLRTTEVTGSRADHARSVAEQLGAVIDPEDGPFASLLRYELDRVAMAETWYLDGEYLAAHNRAFWFHEIEALSAEHGLRYVADARFNRPEGGLAVALLERVGDGLPIGTEEAVDLVGYRRFRHAVLCRATAKPPAGHPVDEAWVASPVGPGEGDEPGLAALLTRLAEEWPRGARLDDPEPVREVLLAGYRGGMVELRLREPEVLEPTPVVSALTRWEAARSDRVTTPYHEVLAVPEEAAAVIGRLDGRPPPEGLVLDEMLDFLGAWGLLD